MTDFKPGDRVRCITDKPFYRYSDGARVVLSSVRSGEVGRVTRPADPDGDIAVIFGDRDTFERVAPECLELVTDEPAAGDVVNRPAHYVGFSNGAEVIDVAECLPFNRGNAIKYVARAGRKDPARELEDLRKAAWYIQREIDRITKA